MNSSLQRQSAAARWARIWPIGPPTWPASGRLDTIVDAFGNSQEFQQRFGQLASIAIHIFDGRQGGDRAVVDNRKKVARHFVTRFEELGMCWRVCCLR